MKILLLGKNGQVGRELQRTLLPFGEIIALDRHQANLENSCELQHVLNTHKPDIIVNAAAYTQVDKAEADEATAFKVNSEAVALLASYAAQTGILLVHYSTDYIFDGLKESDYLETDSPNPQNIYGSSKRAGEIAIQNSGCNSLIFRTSWVFSSNGGNFIKTILGLAKERESLNIVADQFGAPTSAELIADITALAIAYYRVNPLFKGIYHLTSSGSASWYDFACHIINRAQANGIKIRLIPQKISPIPTEDYPLPAKRPKNSRMNTSALSLALGLQLPDWKLHVDRTVDHLTGSNFFDNNLITNN